MFQTRRAPRIGKKKKNRETKSGLMRSVPKGENRTPSLRFIFWDLRTGGSGGKEVAYGCPEGGKLEPKLEVFWPSGAAS